MAGFGFSVGDFVTLGALARRCYTSIRDGHKHFFELQLEAESFLVNVRALSEGATLALVEDYVKSDGNLGDKGPRHAEVTALARGMTQVVILFYLMFEEKSQYFKDSGANPPITLTEPRDLLAIFTRSLNLKLNKPRKSRPWTSWSKPIWIGMLQAAFDLDSLEPLRIRFAAQAANLNIFLTRLTHAQMEKHAAMLTLNWTDRVLYGGRWPEIVNLSGNKDQMRKDIALYLSYLYDGGPPLQQHDLNVFKMKMENHSSGGVQRHLLSPSPTRRGIDGFVSPVSSGSEALDVSPSKKQLELDEPTIDLITRARERIMKFEESHANTNNADSEADEANGESNEAHSNSNEAHDESNEEDSEDDEANGENEEADSETDEHDNEDSETNYSSDTSTNPSSLGRQFHDEWMKQQQQQQQRDQDRELMGRYLAARRSERELRMLESPQVKGERLIQAENDRIRREQRRWRENNDDY